MRLALEQADLAAAEGDVPVGAIVVAADGSTDPAVARTVGGAAGVEPAGTRIIGAGHNRREATGDPTAHAEIEALRAAARTLGLWRIEGTLYVTQEPCPMCAGALVNARIRRLVYGCPNPKAGAVTTLYSIPTDVRLNHRMAVTGGVLAEECAERLRRFFAALRHR